MNRITMEWIDEQIERELERGATPSAINDLAALAEVRRFMMERDANHEEEMVPRKERKHGLTAEEAQEWVRRMEAADPACKSGGKWSWDAAKLVAEDHGIHADGQMMIDFYAALNMVYSDYCKVARDHKVANEDFFVDMAMAFLFDRDGIDPSDKICAYHKYIARHDYDVF